MIRAALFVLSGAGLAIVLYGTLARAVLQHH